ncbi:MAG TPA: hypothetical protein VIJ82_01745 [Streptosporangiaceae bacterium]
MTARPKYRWLAGLVSRSARASRSSAALTSGQSGGSSPPLSRKPPVNLGGQDAQGRAGGPALLDELRQVRQVLRRGLQRGVGEEAAALEGDGADGGQHPARGLA